MADSIALTDLDVITKYSIAVRKATADRDELIETLRADLAWLERGQRRTRLVPAEVEAAPAEVEADYDDGYDEIEAEVDEAPVPPRPPLRRMPVKVKPTPARKPAVKKTAAKKTAAKKTAARRTAR